MTDRPEWTGERFLPWIEGSEIHYEHLHRYCFASSLVSGKRVLDIASGEGYGSSILSNKAASVMGMDIDPIVVEHAQAKYGSASLAYCAGSLLDIPVKNNSPFDVAVCFEAIEHVVDHQRFLAEVKRILNKDGLFVLSTPNKKKHDGKPADDNPYHVKELYLNEFIELLGGFFKHCYIMGQSVCAASRIFSVDHSCGDGAADYFIKKADEGYGFDNKAGLIPDYYIALVSDKPLDLNLLNDSSHLIDNSNVLLDELKSAVKYYQGQLSLKDGLLDEKTQIINGITQKNMSLEGALQKGKQSKSCSLIQRIRKLICKR